MIFSGKRGSVMLLDLRKLILPGFFTQGTGLSVTGFGIG